MIWSEIALLCVGVAIVAGAAGYYWGWNDGVQWAYHERNRLFRLKNDSAREL